VTTIPSPLGTKETLFDNPGEDMNPKHGFSANASELDKMRNSLNKGTPLLWSTVL
jgi:hypothetical protein